MHLLQLLLLVRCGEEGKKGKPMCARPEEARPKAARMCLRVYSRPGQVDPRQSLRAKDREGQHASLAEEGSEAGGRHHHHHRRGRKRGEASAPFTGGQGGLEGSVLLQQEGIVLFQPSLLAVGPIAKGRIRGGAAACVRVCVRACEGNG